MNIDVPQERIEEFRRRWRIRELMPFGSVVRDDFRPDSDVDVLVTFEPDAAHTLFDIAEMQEEIEELFGRDVDMVERTSLVNPFIRAAVLQPDRPRLTPAEQDLAYLWHMRDALGKLARYVAGKTYADFEGDTLLQDGVVRQLRIVGDTASRVSDETAARCPEVPWGRVAGFRSVISHENDRAKLRRIWTAVGDQVPALTAQLAAIFAELGNDAEHDTAA
jgi:uncharacterized protein with HEPN domain/predicted nucleotidyltransferase